MIGFSDRRHDHVGDPGETWLRVTVLPRRGSAYETVLWTSSTRVNMERVTGFEPVSAAWRAAILPLNDTRLVTLIVKGLTPDGRRI